MKQKRVWTFQTWHQETDCPDIEIATNQIEQFIPEIFPKARLWRSSNHSSHVSSIWFDHAVVKKFIAIFVLLWAHNPENPKQNPQFIPIKHREYAQFGCYHYVHHQYIVVNLLFALLYSNKNEDNKVFKFCNNEKLKFDRVE